MEQHEHTFWYLLIIGALIGFSRLLVSNEPLSWRLVIGRTILGSATSSVAGLVLIQFPDIPQPALIGLACALGILGSTFIEEYLKKNIKRWGG